MESWPRSWEVLVEEAFGPGTRIVFPRFFESKKNQVTLLTLVRDAEPFEVLAKRFVWGSAAREHEVLSRAHARGLAVPRPLGLHGDVCFMQALPATRLRGAVGPRVALALGEWLARFHRGMRTPQGALLRGDCVLPNFLQAADGTLYGVDFEESRPGEPLEDVAQLAVSLLLGSRPPDFAALRRFLEGYGEPLSGALQKQITTDLEARLRFVPERRAEILDCARALAAQQPEPL